MNTLRISILSCFAFSLALLPSVWANHRTGDLATPEQLKAGDVNGDGNADLVVNVTGFDNAATLLGDGQGGFTLKSHTGADTLPKGMDIGDVNGDGRLDVVQANNWGYTIFVDLGNGKGTFTNSLILPGDGEPIRLMLADYNNDGLLDIATNAPDEGKILLYLGDRTKYFQNPAIEIEDVGQGYGMSSADLNGDGNLDMAMCKVSPDVGNSFIDILLGDGTGAFRLSTFSVLDAPSSVQPGDFTGDGIVDLAVGGALPENATGNFISIYVGNGRGAFALKQTTQLGPGNLKGDIALGDYNEDGKLDVAFPVTGLQIHGQHSTIVRMFFGDGTGNLVEGPTLTVGQEPHTAIKADFNNDGHLDLAVTNRTDGTVTVLLGDGTGHFPTSTTVSVVCPTCLPEQ